MYKFFLMSVLLETTREAYYSLANVKAFVNKSRRVTLEVVANRFSIGKASAHKILHEHPGMSKVSARWVPRQMSADQKGSQSNQCKRTFKSFKS